MAFFFLESYVMRNYVELKFYLLHVYTGLNQGSSGPTTLNGWPLSVCDPFQYHRTLYNYGSLSTFVQLLSL